MTRSTSARDVLLIDIGNTRIKWRHVQENWSEADVSGQVLHEQSTTLARIWQTLNVASAHIASVAAASVLQEVVAALPNAVKDVHRAHMLQASAQRCGVVNTYREPGRLGADRWAALIGARALYSQQPCLIASFGTATTIDVLTFDGVFDGGVILPGVMTMRQSLAEHTAGLGFTPPALDTPGQVPATKLDHRTLADNTEDAIASGILQAQAGALERVWRETSVRMPDVKVLLCGGHAHQVAALLAFPVLHEPALVLRGLYTVASAARAT